MAIACIPEGCDFGTENKAKVMVLLLTPVDNPNLHVQLLSGLAARHRLRCFEMPVPQHDRKTGEVSIKKWKLLKAAAKSFFQTIWFSFRRISMETP